MLDGLFKNLTSEDKDAAIENIIQHATPRQDFFLMLVLSVSMAAFGILLESTVILVGSMLIAPLLYPLLSLSLGIIMADDKLIGLALYTLGKSAMFSVGSGFAVGFLFSGGGADLSNIAGIPHSMMYAIVAAIAGFAAAFAVTKPHLNSMLPGVAISVALVPPLAAVGIALSAFDWAAVSDSLVLFIVNIIGIIFSALIVFALFRFSAKKSVAHEVIKEEEKIIQREESAA